MRVYGSKISYFTGKLESYLRYKRISYELVPAGPHQGRMREHVGTAQVPAVERDDGRWMTDSTPIILALESELVHPPVLPPDPVVRFIALLIEDYADEWLWRPAMHYRWSYAHDRELLSSTIVDELMGHIPLPRFAKRWLIQLRQRGGFVVRDGVRPETREHVEAGYFQALDNMTTMLHERPFLLGDAPSIADIGLMGPMLRHFGQDPTPAQLMRQRGPEVYEWVARMWNARPPNGVPCFVDHVPEDAAPMLQEICETHLVQLRDNASAWAAKSRRFEMTVQGCHYVALPVSRYRVACLERLRDHFEALAASEQEAVRGLLPHPDAAILWDEGFRIESGYDPECTAPYNQAINVYGTGVPFR